MADQSSIRAIEHRSADGTICDEAFMKYAEGFFTERFGSAQSNWPVSFDKRENGWVPTNESACAGILSYNKTRLSLIPKVEANIYYMMLSLRSLRSFHMDTKELIDIEEGDCFLEVLASIFLGELENLLERGLLKRYVLKEENRTFLKGKLLVDKNNQMNLGIKPKFYCSFHDLTYDNLENRIILRALNLVIPLVKVNVNLKNELLGIQRQLLEEVELDTSIGPSDCYRLRLDRLSLHYEKALEISKIILEESFVRSTEKGRSKGFNFIVDMNRLFEDFLTEMTRQIMSEKCPRLQVIDQMGFNSLDRDGKLTIKPDLLIFNQMSGKFPIIIDAKYKLDVKNPDVYQMIAYSLAIPDSKVACLLYPDSEGNYDMRFDIRRDLFGYENDYLPLLIRTINLSAKTEESYNAFVQRVKNELWSILVELMDIAGLINNLLKGAQKGSIAEKT